MWRFQELVVSVIFPILSWPSRPSPSLPSPLQRQTQKKTKIKKKKVRKVVSERERGGWGIGALKQLKLLHFVIEFPLLGNQIALSQNAGHLLNVKRRKHTERERPFCKSSINCSVQRVCFAADRNKWRVWWMVLTNRDDWSTLEKLALSNNDDLFSKAWVIWACNPGLHMLSCFCILFRKP